MTRDLEWDALVTTSERLSTKYGTSVKATERRGLAWIVAGFEAPSVGRFEAVCRRRPFTRSWEEITPIGEAASRLGASLTPSSE